MRSVSAAVAGLCALLLIAVAFAATAVKRAEIGFAPGTAEISPIVRTQISRLIVVLTADLATGASIEIEAYAQARAARVLAVERAADVRRALIENGLPAERIAVHVADESQPADTIVIFVRR